MLAARPTGLTQNLSDAAKFIQRGRTFPSCIFCTQLTPDLLDNGLYNIAHVCKDAHTHARTPILLSVRLFRGGGGGVLRGREDGVGTGRERSLERTVCGCGLDSRSMGGSSPTQKTHQKGTLSVVQEIYKARRRPI